MEASTQIFVIGWKIALPVFLATFLLEVDGRFCCAHAATDQYDGGDGAAEDCWSA